VADQDVLALGDADHDAPPLPVAALVGGDVAQVVLRAQLLGDAVVDFSGPTLGVERRLRNFGATFSLKVNSNTSLVQSSSTRREVECSGSLMDSNG
jgi:hypothetical protein